MGGLLALSNVADRVLERIARATGWLFILLIVTICWDVLTRKIGFQLPGFGSTPIQELEWHLHGALFMFWLGYAYVRNVHVRIDVFTGGMPKRKQAWLEVWGIVVFAIPYCLVATYFAYGFALTSFLQQEGSAAPNGLPFLWIIKSCLFLGLVLLDIAVLSVLARCLAFLLGSPSVSAAAAPKAAGH